MYITSLLVAMERSLSSPPKNGWERVNQNQAFELLHMVFLHTDCSDALSRPTHTSSKQRFQYEEAGRCRSISWLLLRPRKISPMNVFPSNTQPFQRLLEEDVISMDSVSPTLRHCSKLFIYLYRVATDSFDR